MIVQAQALGINVTLKTLNNNLFAKPTSTFTIKASPFFLPKVRLHKLTLQIYIAIKTLRYKDP
jgi:hypothetical protein